MKRMFYLGEGMLRVEAMSFTLKKYDLVWDETTVIRGLNWEESDVEGWYRSSEGGWKYSYFLSEVVGLDLDEVLAMYEGVEFYGRFSDIEEE